MIEIALDFLRGQLQAYVAARTGVLDAEVALTRVVDETGKWAVPPDALGITLLSVDQERTFRAQVPTQTLIDGQLVTQEPELRLAMHVLVTAHYQRYDEALKHLSHALTFFQSHPFFTPDRDPALDPRVGKLTSELLTLGFEQLNQVWAFLGARQLPSAIYRVHMVVLQDLEPTFVGPPVMTITSTIGSR